MLAESAAGQPVLGGRPSPELRDQLVSQLEALGVVRRDDERRTVLWVEPDPEEAPLAETLRAARDGGRLSTDRS